MRDRYSLVKKSCLCGCPQGNRLQTISVRISKDEASFDCYLLGRCERKTTTLWSAALCIPRPHIRVAFSLWTDWWWKRASFAIRLSGLFVTSETYVTDLARISRLKQADEIRPDRHVFLPSQTYLLSWKRHFIRFKGHVMHQTPSTGLRHPSFNHCRI